jgi:hypothetical protein
MPYFLTTLITLILTLADISIVPRLSYYLSLPILALPFIVIVCLRDRTIYPIILALISGIIYSAASGNSIYVLTFLFVAAIGKVFFANSQNYNYIRSSLALLLIGLAGTIFASYGIIMKSYLNPSLYLLIGLYLLSSIALLPIYGFIGRRFFDYIDKYTAERFR